RFIDAGFEDVAFEPMAFAVTDLAVADPIVGLTEGAGEAVGDGMISAGRAQAWLDSLKAANSRGRFVASLTGFIVSGRVPAASLPVEAANLLLALLVVVAVLVTVSRRLRV